MIVAGRASVRSGDGDGVNRRVIQDFADVLHARGLRRLFLCHGSDALVDGAGVHVADVSDLDVGTARKPAMCAMPRPLQPMIPTRILELGERPRATRERP